MILVFIGTCQPTQPPSIPSPEPSISSLRLKPLSPPPPSYNLQPLSSAARFPPTVLQLQSPCVRVLPSLPASFAERFVVHFSQSLFHARHDLIKQKVCSQIQVSVCVRVNLTGESDFQQIV